MTHTTATNTDPRRSDETAEHRRDCSEACP